ncbi:MAG TPA: DUF177 domain-containing protein [Dongiaceae bacterium]|jgi:uncharacterized metal-binding protein YceD (DUF177 family)|nr:DUF177 domain-containing protein [Dongiaceae bacterium]
MPRRHSDSQEFSRFIEADSVGAQPIERRISANAEERAALARRFDLQAIDRLEADFTLRRAGNGVIHVRGTVRGEVVQSCVVTLEPVPARIEDEFAADFAAETDHPAEDEEIDFEAADPPEPIRNGHIDLGELAAEHLSLALDPYPRAPGARLAQGPAPDESENRPVNPFSILKK